MEPSYKQSTASKYKQEMKYDFKWDDNTRTGVNPAAAASAQAAVSGGRDSDKFKSTLPSSWSTN